nr:MAG TPA: hypothetical protein [Caudoviricetes sp.]
MSSPFILFFSVKCSFLLDCRFFFDIIEGDRRRKYGL